MKLYLDNGCYNRLLDDRSKLRIRLEAEAVEAILADVRSGRHQLIWSYILDYENSQTPQGDRRERVAAWRQRCIGDMAEDDEIHTVASMLRSYCFRPLDALHLACAIRARCHHFITTDGAILHKAPLFQDIQITDPIGFIKIEARAPLRWEPFDYTKWRQRLVEKGYLTRIPETTPPRYKVVLRRRRARQVPTGIWDALADKVEKEGEA